MRRKTRDWNPSRSGSDAICASPARHWITLKVLSFITGREKKYLKKYQVVLLLISHTPTHTHTHRQQSLSIWSVMPARPPSPPPSTLETSGATHVCLLIRPYRITPALLKWQDTHTRAQAHDRPVCGSLRCCPRRLHTPSTSPETVSRQTWTDAEKFHKKCCIQMAEKKFGFFCARGYTACTKTINHYSLKHKLLMQIFTFKSSSY